MIDPRSVAIRFAHDNAPRFLEELKDFTSIPSISQMEFVIAPEPNILARPATVGECQSRAQ